MRFEDAELGGVLKVCVSGFCFLLSGDQADNPHLDDGTTCCRSRSQTRTKGRSKSSESGGSREEEARKAKERKGDVDEAAEVSKLKVESRVDL